MDISGQDIAHGQPVQVMEEQQARSTVRKGGRREAGGKENLAGRDGCGAGKNRDPRKSSSTTSGWTGVLCRTPLTAWVARSTAE